MKTPRRRSSAGFTLIEMLVVAPLVILSIGAFITVIISMTGEVLSSRASNSLAYNIQDAMTRIEQDVNSSTAFLAENNFNPTAAQGSNSDTTRFVNVGGSYGPALILNTYATTANPITSASRPIFLANQPYACSNTLVTSNVPLMMNIVYFVKDNALWRRTIMPPNYTTSGCAAPWQQPSCAPGQAGSFCITNDIKLVEGVTSASFIPSYFPSASSTSANATAVDTGQSTQARNAALNASPTVNVSLSAEQIVAGRTVSRTAALRATRLDVYGSATTITPEITNGLVGWWTFNGNANDSSGLGNNGTTNSVTLTTGQNGQANSAYSFNGNTSFISISNNSVFNSPELTMSSWAKSAVNSGTHTFMAKETSYKYRVGAGSGAYGALVSSNGTGWTATPSATGSYPLNTWVHVAFTVSSANNQIIMYVNGSPISTTALGGSITAYSANLLRIGSHSTGVEAMNGDMDDARFYNRALSAAEIAVLYANGAR